MTVTDWQPITHVWSSFGHRFYSAGCDHEDGSSCESCMTCGAVFELRPRVDDPGGGDYIAANGDDPTPCTGDTAMCHGEQPCQADGGRPCNGDDADGPCPHESHECNCLICTG
ncbi:hypothetical protein LO772_27345 [Yinghuangia sp. ASG 101]|uniref:hypothetical protein n=1 Tax=Yinghuangia sp. ASG 101 TaxID=2896848 RepID=UPI001E65134D|nr:hypothetical protein [Yinghuangia sp. ASG 101]UGQ10530.1 hypothetical protein LO772_27345 [Yinghuangia sp. ASG 101]